MIREYESETRKKQPAPSPSRKMRHAQAPRMAHSATARFIRPLRFKGAGCSLPPVSECLARLNKPLHCSMGVESIIIRNQKEASS